MSSIRFPRHPVKEREDINELDNLLLGLLDGPPRCDSWVREEGANPSRSRRFIMGTKPVNATSASADGKARGVGCTMSQKTCQES